MPLEVGIVGAGIAGLATAIALRRTGANVELFDQSHFRSESGAAITITPNGSRILDEWGWDYEAAGPVDSEFIMMIQADTLATLYREDFEDIEKEFGYRLSFYHRADLHHCLWRLAESDQLPGKLALRPGAKVEGIDSKSGKILLEDGSQRQKDLVVVANGVWTSLVGELGLSPAPAKTGKSVFRALIPMERFREVEELSQLIGPKLGMFAAFDKPTGANCVLYPCRGGKMMNMAVVVPMVPGREDATDWQSKSSIDEMLSAVPNFHPALLDLFRKAPDVRLFTAATRQTPDRLFSGRAVVLGDAVHAMLPYHTQGGVLALEEAAALGSFFSGFRDGEDITRRLQLFQDTMLKHVQLVQLLSNAQLLGVNDARRRAEEIHGPGLFDATAMPQSKPVRDFFWKYNVFEEVEKTLRSAGLGGQVNGH